MNNDERCARIWPDYVNLEKRAEREVPFLLQHFGRDARVFNASLGSGETTLSLHRAGVHNITSNDISEAYIAVAQKQATKYGVPLNITRYDWRALPEKFTETFDVALNLGNSLTCLLKPGDQLLALQEFYRVLRPGGKLVVDQRNYAHHLLSDPTGGNFRWSGEVVYCGKDAVTVAPIGITDDRITLEYRHKRTGETAHILVYPFKEGELRDLIHEAGFSHVKTFGDYKEQFKPEEPEFLTHVAVKNPS